MDYVETVGYTQHYIVCKGKNLITVCKIPPLGGDMFICRKKLRNGMIPGENFVYKAGRAIKLIAVEFVDDACPPSFVLPF